jgi:outer membrane protein OmpA-like peptidoglycan-associated protein
MRSFNRPTPLLFAASLLASCAGYHVRQGEQAMAMMAYAKAERHFNKALANNTDRSVLLLAAMAEMKQDKVEPAVAHYGTAEAMAPLSGPDALNYGQLLMGIGQYEKAQPLLVRALQDQPERQGIAELIGACQGYRSFYADSSRYTVKPLELAGIASAYSPAPFKGNLFFAGIADNAPGKREPWSGNAYADLYQATIAPDGTASQVKNVGSPVNGPFHEGPAVLSADGTTLYFTRSNYYGDRKLRKDNGNVSNLKLFRATLGNNGEWTNIREFGYNSDSYSLGTPALSKDGKTLFFTSDMPGGMGGKDIWYSTDPGTGWSAPVNMGPTINTAGDEMFPTVVGDALYFSSTSHNNMGGLDIFETHRTGNFWSEPQNPGYPINSTRDDFGLYLDSTGTKGYLSSSRNGTDRIYLLNVVPQAFAVEGTITSSENGNPVPFALVLLNNMADSMMQQGNADAHGHYRFDLTPNTAYSITASHDGMLTQSLPVSTLGLTASTTLRSDIALAPLAMDKPMVIPDIYYDYDKWDIRPDAAAQLDKVAKIFKDNPGLTFELGAHTDSRGGDTYNLVLSDARAKSAVDYLIRQGVPPDRLTARGYGETMPVNGCVNGVKCTEEEHQANRRTELKVVSKDSASTH